MMRVRIILAVLVVASLVASLGAAQDTTTSLDKAIAGYGDALDTEDHDLRIEGFRRVERLFGSAVEGGYATADLYANLGNAALQAEHLGSAVLAYRRALVLDPDHDRARQNLIHVRDQVPDWVPRPDRSTAFDSFFSVARQRVRNGTGVGGCPGFLDGRGVVVPGCRGAKRCRTQHRCAPRSRLVRPAREHRARSDRCGEERRGCRGARSRGAFGRLSARPGTLCETAADGDRG